MKRYIDFVQKPKKGQEKTEEPAAFISVPEKTPAQKPVSRPAPRPVQRPAIKPAQSPVKKPTTATATPVRRPIKPVGIDAPVHRPIRPVGIDAPVRRVIKPVGIDAPVHRAVQPAPAKTTPVKPVAQKTPTPKLSPQKPIAQRQAVQRPVVQKTSVSRPVIAKSTPVKPVQKPVEKPVEKSVQKTASSDFEDFDSIFGIIEDYRPANHPQEIEKRPLSTPEKREKTSDQAIDEALEELAKEEPGNTQDLEEAISDIQSVKESPAKHSSRINELLKSGKSPFIRTGAIEKRPLSNSVATKKPAIKPSLNEPSDPATIIEKPEKDAHVGIIITVILTIIFGAAIGTAAFLLLPKN